MGSTRTLPERVYWVICPAGTEKRPDGLTITPKSYSVNGKPPPGFMTDVGIPFRFEGAVMVFTSCHHRRRNQNRYRYRYRL